MATFLSMLQTMKQAQSYHEKAQFTSFFLNNLESNRMKLTADDKSAYASVVLEEIAAAKEILPVLTSYKEKDSIFAFLEQLFFIITLCYASPADVPKDTLDEVMAFRLTINKERFVENEVDHVFGDDHHSKYEMEHLIELLTPVKDEFQRGQLYVGMLHYKDKLGVIPEDAKVLLTAYIADEFKRYLEAELTEDVINCLEVMSDVCGYILNDELIGLLYEALKLGHANINFYALSTLLKAGKCVPDEAISVLAEDLEYASMVYGLLEQHGQVNRFPSEYSGEEYLAKSSMIRWLVYPTELGQLPDEIEYLGKVKKKEIYHIFRFKSNSNNLDEETKDQWLVGWSSEEGGTFSNFDLYADVEQKTVDKTLKYIKRKLL